MGWHAQIEVREDLGEAPSFKSTIPTIKPVSLYIYKSLHVDMEKIS